MHDTLQLRRHLQPPAHANDSHAAALPDKPPLRRRMRAGDCIRADPGRTLDAE
jgi:hypothetical protein